MEPEEKESFGFVEFVPEEKNLENLFRFPRRTCGSISSFSSFPISLD
jgi:hypothetical protein